jgi:hypothetical protein
MREGIFIIPALIMSSGIAAAQMQGGQDGQHMMGGQGMMSGQHMMGRGHMTSDQQ